jgi:hypothetical protein
MAASTITIKLAPGEYATLKVELDKHIGNLNFQRANDTDHRHKHEIGGRIVQLEKLAKEI